MSEADAPITLDQLRVFLAVVEAGSFSKAAKRLRRVQSAVSYSIGNLERLLDVALFDRTGRRPSLTAAGRALLPEARATVEQVDRLTARARQIASGLEPKVSLVVDVLFPMPALVDALHEFRERFGEVDLDLRTEALGAVIELVEDGTCQLGVAVALLERPHTLESAPLTTVELVPVCAPDHPLADVRAPIGEDELQGQIQIVVSDRSTRTEGVDRGVFSKRTWRVANLDSKVALLIAGYGFGNLPRHVAEPAIERGELTRLELGETALSAPLVAINRIAEPPGLAGRWLLETLGRRLE